MWSLSQVTLQAGAYLWFLHHQVNRSISTPPRWDVGSLSGYLPVLSSCTGTHLFTWVDRSTARVKSLAQEHNTVSLARARTQAAQSGDKRTNHEATVPPT